METVDMIINKERVDVIVNALNEKSARATDSKEKQQLEDTLELFEAAVMYFASED